jgi:hypothetical protein
VLGEIRAFERQSRKHLNAARGGKRVPRREPAGRC